jgi:hypothetical protein
MRYGTEIWSSDMMLLVAEEEQTIRSVDETKNRARA